MPFFNTKVPADYQGAVRLDKYIASIPDGMNRSKLKSGVTTIFLNGEPAKLSAKVSANNQIDIEWEDNIPTDITPENIPLNIIYEDDNVTVVNKEQGMVTHPASGNWTGTLVNALLFHWARSAFKIKTEGTPSELLAERRPGIVHRLDKDTSGVIITAKNREAEEWLQNQFKDHDKLVKKEYIAICTGIPKSNSGIIHTQIIRDPKDRKKYKAIVDSKAGKTAETEYECIARYGTYSVMRLLLRTGRTHQIRVHLKYLGCPILGDPIYGRKTTGTPFEEATLMLHAYILKIRLPNEENLSEFKAPIPERFISVINKLRELFSNDMKEDEDFII